MGLRQASMVNALTPVQYDIVYNLLSLGLASMMASTVFFFLRLQSFHERYKAALCFTGLVTFIAAYHYFRIFNSFVEAYTPCEVVDGVVNPQVRCRHLRILPHRPLLQRCLPLCRLVPYRASAPHRDCPGHEALRSRDLLPELEARVLLCPHDPQRVPG